MSTQATPSTHPVATIVSEDDREKFLSNLFGPRHVFVVENVLYEFMGSLSPEDYGGGFWEFYQLADRPLYLVPPQKDRYRISCDGNGFSGEVSADAAGIIATLFTLSHMSFAFESAHLSEGFQRLYTYATEHPEARAIFRAID